MSFSLEIKFCSKVWITNPIQIASGLQIQKSKIFSISCGRSQNSYKVLQLANDSLKVTIKIKEPIEINNELNDYWTIKGFITIKNKKALVTKYCNGLTRLVINEKDFARCYINTIASVQVDVGWVSLKPHERLEYEIYWKFHQKIDTIKKLDLVWHMSYLVNPKKV